jgi:hypothetical protein
MRKVTGSASSADKAVGGIGGGGAGGAQAAGGAQVTSSCSTKTFTVALLSLCLLVVAILFTVSGCAKNENQSKQEVYPNLTISQEEGIYKKTIDTINEADKTGDNALLKSRMSGPALTIRSTQEELSSIEDIKRHMDIPESSRQVIISNTNGWPRVSIIITNPTPERETERVVTLVQKDAHSLYKVWGITRSFSNTQFPSFANPEIGSKLLEPDDDSLKYTPYDAMEKYASLLQDGKQSKIADEFSDDELQSSMIQLTETVQKGVEANQGSQNQVFSSDPKEIYAISASDGGALVTGVINSTWTRESGEGRFAKPADESEEILFKDKTATSKIEVKYINLVTLYIPIKDSSEQMRAIAAERIPIEVNPI